MNGLRRIFYILALLLSLTAVGTLGFHFFQGKGWIESAYLAVITLSTVGSRDPASTQAEMIFVIIYLTFGLAVFTFSLFTLGQTLFDARLHSAYRRRKMNQTISGLSNHYIVCGLGRMGRTICEFLAERKEKFVVVDIDEDIASQLCDEKKWLYVVGDATDDEVLVTAGIERAGAMATVLTSDSDNVLVTLSSRMLNSNVPIVARASSDKAVQKMERAGATRVISPYSSGAIKMARFMMNPALENFIEVAHGSGNDLELAEIQVSKESPFFEKQLRETNLSEMGIMIIGVERVSGERFMPPPGTTVIHEGDSLFAFGNSEAVTKMIEMDKSMPSNS